ncbi:MAG: alpha/beta hydrolase [Chloroflexia bacterium]
MRFEDVTFRNGETQLAGLLTMPEGYASYPAIAIVDGSGEGVRKDPLFAVLAELFGSAGFATLTWDKPGYGDSTGSWANQTFEDRAHEAIAATSYLRNRPDIKANSVGLWGVSQGGWVTPLAASLSNDIAFVISVSGPGVSPHDQEIYRVEHELRSDGISPEEIKQALAFYSGRLQMIRDGRSLEEIYALYPEEKLKSSVWVDYVPELGANEVEFMTGIMDYDPRPILRAVRCPLLGIWGETDRLVPALLSAEIFRQELEAGDNDDFTLKIFADADHGINTNETGSRTERAQRRERNERYFAPGYFDLMKNWLSERYYAPVGAASLLRFPDVS